MSLVLLAANTKGGNVRRAVLEDKPHVIVPTVMMTSGVVSGSNGALYYPSDEMKKNVQSWNNRPVVVYHPTKKGKPSTAADPEVLNKQKVGVVLNAQFSEKGKPRWKADVWINEELGKKYMPEVMEKIYKGEPVEVSTGLYTENEEMEGSWNGKKYTAIAREYIPDHLAILPTGTGASSIKDGTGLNLNAARTARCAGCGCDMSCPNCDKSPTANAMSFSKIFNTLQKGLDEKFGPYRVNVQDVYPSFLVYAKRDDNGNRKLYKQDYKVDNRKGEIGKVSFTGDSVQVEQITEYRTSDGKFVGNSIYCGNLPEEKEMADKKIVDSVIANSNGQLEEADREWLSKKSEQWLAQLPGGIPIPPVAAPVAQPAPVANATPVAKPTFQELLANADPATQEAIQEAMVARETERGKLIATITANSKNVFTADQLKNFKLPDLRALAALAAPAVPETPVGPVANWAGAAGYAPPVANGSPANAPVLPSPGSSKFAKTA